MSKVSNFGKKISNKTKEISQKAKIYSETNSLGNVVKAEEGKINNQYRIIGKLYFEKFGENPDEAFTEAVDIIKSSMEKIEETNKEITKIKSRFNCPNCGYAFKNDALFCSKCGTKLPEREEPEEKLPKNSQKCTNCGVILPIDALFCKDCGTKLDTQVVTALPEEKEVSSEEFAPVESENVVEVTEAAEITEVVETEEALTEEKTAENAEEVTVEEKPEEAVTEEKSDETPSEIIEEAEILEVVEADEKADESEPTETTAADDSVELSFEKICPNCKNKVEDDDLFCNECGTKLA